MVQENYQGICQSIHPLVLVYSLSHYVNALTQIHENIKKDSKKSVTELAHSLKSS